MRRPVLFAATLLALAVPTLGLAADKHPQHRIAIQVDQGDPAVMNLALNNASNVIEYYRGKGENVQVEIVAYGPGINMLKMDSPVAGRVDEALGAGIKVVACENTMRNAKLTKADMMNHVGYVPAGVVEIMQKQQQGWAYLRP